MYFGWCFQACSAPTHSLSLSLSITVISMLVQLRYYTLDIRCGLSQKCSFLMQRREAGNSCCAEVIVTVSHNHGGAAIDLLLLPREPVWNNEPENEDSISSLELQLLLESTRWKQYVWSRCHYSRQVWQWNSILQLASSLFAKFFCCEVVKSVQDL